MRPDFPPLRTVALGNFEAVLGWKVEESDRLTDNMFALLYYQCGSQWCTLDHLMEKSAIENRNQAEEMAKELAERGLVDVLGAELTGESDGISSGDEGSVIDLTAQTPPGEQSKSLSLLPVTDIVDILFLLSAKVLSKVAHRKRSPNQKRLAFRRGQNQNHFRHDRLHSSIRIAGSVVGLRTTLCELLGPSFCVLRPVLYWIFIGPT